MSSQIAPDWTSELVAVARDSRSEEAGVFPSRPTVLSSLTAPGGKSSLSFSHRQSYDCITDDESHFVYIPLPIVFTGHQDRYYGGKFTPATDFCQDAIIQQASAHDIRQKMCEGPFRRCLTAEHLVADQQFSHHDCAPLFLHC